MNEETKIKIEETYNKKNKSVKQEKVKKENMVNLETKIIGWVGTIILIIAYSLNSLGYLDSQNIIYPIMNLLAALLLAIRVFADKNWSNLFLEAFWGAVAVVSIIKYFTF